MGLLQVKIKATCQSKPGKNSLAQMIGARIEKKITNCQQRTCLLNNQRYKWSLYMIVR